jgi:hypothetical protein
MCVVTFWMRWRPELARTTRSQQHQQADRRRQGFLGHSWLSAVVVS